MIPVALGVDIVSVSKLSSYYSDPIDCVRFLTSQEADEVGSFADRADKLASKWCLKEAVVKALGGLQQGIALTDIHTSHDSSGAPTIILTGGALSAANERGITTWLASTSHSGDMAIAQVIGLTVFIR